VFGFEPNHTEEDVMGKPNGLSRGDARRNARLERLRAVVRAELGIVAIDLADDKQVVVVCDHDGRVLARRTWRCKAWALTPALRWARERAIAHGFAGAVVGCEPTGHRWKVVAGQAEAVGMALVCVSSMLVARGREEEDLTRDRSDDKDAMVIARLVATLRCYLPERADETWARLRHLGARRARLVTHDGAARQQLRDLLECAWPAALDAAAQPLDSKSWRAALEVVLVDYDADLGRVAAADPSVFAEAVRRRLPRWGTRRGYWRIVSAVRSAAADPAGVPTQRRGALERCGFVLADHQRIGSELAEVEARMVDLLDGLGLIEFVTSIDGLSAVGAAAILAETGDPHRYDSARAVVKHAGLCPRDNASGRAQGTTRISGRGRPALRLAVWRAVWGALPHNVVYARRYHQLTTRERNRLTADQARVAIGAALLRQLFVVVTTATPWNAEIAAGLHRPLVEQAA
jgi:transposase